MNITNWISAISVLVAALAFVFNLYKQRQDAALQRELEAKRRWTAFMDMAFEHPDYSYKPDYCWRCVRVKGEARPREDVLHKQFISRFLFTAEEVLEVSPDDREWSEAISSQLTCHKHYFLNEMTDRQLKSYSKKLRNIVGAWRKEVTEKAESNA